ncbi:MAG: hypothetical protein GY930_20420 [bacterium]|nr:hypothetical protein [bacterium]
MQIRPRDTFFPILALGFLALGATSQGDSDSALAQRVQALETSVQKLRGTVETQRNAATALLKSLDAAEKAGFTAGINPKSREILLGAWRAQAKALGKPSKKDDKTKKGSRR